MSIYQRTKALNGYSSLYPQFNKYITDGKGRDMYINYNNAGFWKDEVQKISLKTNYSQKYVPVYHTLFHQAAPFAYHSDGTGRDGYVLFDTGLKRRFTPGNKFVFHELLREYPEKAKNFRYSKISQSEILQSMKIRKIEKDVTDRLYTTPKNKHIEDLPKLIKEEPLIKFYAKTSLNFYTNPRGKYSLTSPKYKEHIQTWSRKDKKKLNINVNNF